MANEESQKPTRRGLLSRWWIRVPLMLVAVPYLTLAGLVFLMQDMLLFHPDATRVSDENIALAVGRDGGEEVWVDAEDGVRLHVMFLPCLAAAAEGSSQVARPTVLYFGGNVETAFLSSGSFGRFRGMGWNVVLATYRGYGRSGGKPSAGALFADALLLHDVMAARADVDPDRIATWGRSLGTGVATHVAAHRKVLGVVLISPFARLSEPAAHHYPWLPVGLLFRHEMDSAAAAASIEAPGLLYHGTNDVVIPYDQAVKLQKAWGSEARLITLEGRGHDDVDMDPSYPDEAYGFLDSLK